MYDKRTYSAQHGGLVKIVLVRCNERSAIQGGGEEAPARPGGLSGLAGGKRVRRQVNPRRGTEKSGESAGLPADSPFHFRGHYAGTQ